MKIQTILDQIDLGSLKARWGPAPSSTWNAGMTSNGKMDETLKRV